ncbi:MAG TPA: cytochrome c peroxidase [Oligoflexus sp.]|uniref:cytochrome-c peroxidase n=1 Tax=Oligoflexus sp. TaxID=1971216 RepID=UPI002D70AA4A|nr:cytochrome c peroxidase [Oligoflexus sp.]HYX31977.1 cytochrome c peroxidase [Oligoflexus sp.]
MFKTLAILYCVILSGAASGSGADQATRNLYKRPASLPFPADNAYSPARESLGKTLFFDPRLSGSNWISCATCHNPGLAWGDGLPKGLGEGMKPLDRRTPTLLNLAWGEIMLWDGRADSLEAQALMPLTSTAEMNMPQDKLVAKLRSIPGYPALFEKAYPGEGLTATTLAKALATYERTIVSGMAPFDRWIQGDDKAISTSAARGFMLFNGKALCARCHSGWRFTDDSFHDIGLADGDRGRGAILPGIEVLQHAFKTPGLRNIDRRAPYMHDGSEATLEQVIEFYNRGGQARRPNQAEDVRPLGLTDQDKADLLAFLKTLTSIDKPVQLPALPQ